MTTFEILLLVGLGLLILQVRGVVRMLRVLNKNYVHAEVAKSNQKKLTQTS